MDYIALIIILYYYISIYIDFEFWKIFVTTFKDKHPINHGKDGFRGRGKVIHGRHTQ